MAVELEVRFSRSKITQGQQSYDLKVEILNATDMPSKVFVMQRGVAPPQGQEPVSTDRFIALADPLDLEEFPEDSPDLENEILPSQSF